MRPRFRFLLTLVLGAAARADEGGAAADWSVHAQSTMIAQSHGDFPAPYSWERSLDPRYEQAETVTATVFLGRKLWPGGELYFNPELTQGSGLSGTSGIAGFPNGEATHAGSVRPSVSTARLFLRQTFGLGGGTEQLADDQNQVAGAVDADRIIVTAGKFAAEDVFDGNAYAHDPRTQFLNWDLMADVAWDYPANAKGYTGGLAVEWHTASRSLRWGFLMEPQEANGAGLDPHVPATGGQVLEAEQRYAFGRHSGAIRILGYWNRAHMGDYAAALRMARPDVTQSRADRSKAGAGLSWDQELAADVGAFARAGCNDGRTESWAFTEADRTATAGLSLAGAAWGRPGDTLAFAGALDGLSDLHRRYLAAGGEGFIVGDGRLNYGTENIFETYYAWRLTGWLTASPDYQYVWHPAYNRDRGPVGIVGLRLHAEY
ncbi:MAG TPA: carbohydrate porin [Opitutaceae bacterium]|jgi:high affinity Mn2+ porin|nr:carbohydrate porin [Opitutaceae bacterium]